MIVFADTLFELTSMQKLKIYGKNIAKGALKGAGVGAGVGGVSGTVGGAGIGLGAGQYVISKSKSEGKELDKREKRAIRGVGTGVGAAAGGISGAGKGIKFGAMLGGIAGVVKARQDISKAEEEDSKKIARAKNPKPSSVKMSKRT